VTLGKKNGKSHYSFSQPITPDQRFSSLLIGNLQKTVTINEIIPGLNATADSFYSSQGRITSLFDDKNESLIDDMLKVTNNELVSIEMETFVLFDLARCSFGSIKAAAATIVLAQRKSNEFLDHDSLHRLEKEAGKAVLDTLCSLQLKQVMDNDDCVWNMKK